MSFRSVPKSVTLNGVIAIILRYFAKFGRFLGQFHTSLKSKCLPVLYYGMEVCPLRKSQLKSLDFAVNSALRKIFDTKSQDIVNECREIFQCLSAELTIASRRWKFLEKITMSPIY